MLRADARNGTLQRDRAGPERYFLDARLGKGPAESSPLHYGRHRSRRRRQRRPGTKAGVFFARMNAPFYSARPCLGVCGPASPAFSPIGLLPSSILEFFGVPPP